MPRVMAASSAAGRRGPVGQAALAAARTAGTSTLIPGPIVVAIVSAWSNSSTELTAALALIQTLTVIAALVILFRATRRLQGEAT